MEDGQIQLLQQAIDQWEAAANQRNATSGHVAVCKAAAESLRLEMITGTPHCACCLKPQPHVQRTLYVAIAEGGAS